MNKHWLYLLLLFVVPLQAQVNLSYYLAEDHPYDPSIPTPQSVLGYEVGNWHVSHDRLIQYTLLAHHNDLLHSAIAFAVAVFDSPDISRSSPFRPRLFTLIGRKANEAVFA